MRWPASEGGSSVKNRGAALDDADRAARGGFAVRGGAGRQPPGAAPAIGDGARIAGLPGKLREPATLFFIHDCSSVWKMKEISRRKSTDVLAGYVRDAELFQEHASVGMY
jgi:hypothetical protein